MLRARGHIGFFGHDDYVEFRNLRVKELPAKHKDNTPPQDFKALFNGKNLNGWKGFGRKPGTTCENVRRKKWPPRKRKPMKA